MDAQADDKAIERVAQTLRRWGMTMPAILFLEAHKPFSFIISQALLVAEPVLGIFVGQDRPRQLARFLEDEGQIERLLVRLEMRR